MEMPDLVALLQNTGVTLVILAYFIFRDYKFMNTLQETLTTLVNTVSALKEWIKKGDESE